jgi:hypothetical protein
MRKRLPPLTTLWKFRLLGEPTVNGLVSHLQTGHVSIGVYIATEVQELTRRPTGTMMEYLAVRSSGCKKVAGSRLGIGKQRAFALQSRPAQALGVRRSGFRCNSLFS